MAKIITLQYAGHCADCGTELPAGTRAKWYGRGRVYGLNCHSKNGSKADYSFRNPGGRSALRNGKRCYPCPTCGRENMLTQADVNLGYQCDYCADAAEGIGWGGEY